MFKRTFVMAACGALALLLTAAGSCPAQVVLFPVGRGGVFFGPGVGFPVGPNYYPNYYRPATSFVPPTDYSSNTQYTATAPTPIYYGADSVMPSYPDANSSAGLVVSAPGTGLQGVSNVTGPPDTASVYPIQSRNYTTVNPAWPPVSKVAGNAALVEVRLPADADLWFDGHKTAQTGSDRSFRSPALEPGQDYAYDVHARWAAGGKPVDETRQVTVHAGDHVVVNFMQPAK